MPFIFAVMNWYYAIEGSSHGPVTERSLLELARAGTVAAGTLIWHPGLEDWAPVSVLKPEILEKCGGGAIVSKANGRVAGVPRPAEPAPERAAGGGGIFRRFFGGGRRRE